MAAAPSRDTLALMTKALDGKVALVTGASRGIGAAIAKRLARDGASVAITFHSSPDKALEVVRAIEAEGVKGLAIQADSGDADAVRHAVQRVVTELGRIDVLVNNAGVVTASPFADVSAEDFERQLAVNVRGVFVATQEAVKHMTAGGRVVMMGSVNADWVPFPGISVYALTKAALVGLTHALARELGPRGITVNNVEPGPVDTDMNPSDGKFAPLVKPTIAIGRYGKTDEIAGLVSYLVGPESAYVNGASIRIDGGASA
jgi:3-oxoacyl-[acyl-carrier protein] reductase